jgi:hypothetical protein
MESSTRYKKYK